MFHSEGGKEVSPRRWPLFRFVDTKIGHGAGKKGGWGRQEEVGGGRRRLGEDKGGYCFFCFGFVTNRRYICIRIDVRKLNKKTWNMLENSNQDMCCFSSF